MSTSVLDKYNYDLSHENLQRVFSKQLIVYKYEDLVKYTDNFSIVLGKGTYGCVCKGKINNLDIAVKKYNTESVEPFLRELMSILQTKHPNIVSIYGICYDQEVCLVLEYMSQGSFQDYINKKEGCVKLGKLEILDAFIELSDTLTYLHACQFLHRDIKPGNILFDDHGKAKFADFNHAVFYNDGESAHENSTIVGTPAYSDPSLVQWNESGYFLDMYSFGITILAVLSEEKQIAGIYGKAYNIYRNRNEEALKKFFKKDWDIKIGMHLLKCAMECTKNNRRDRIEASDLSKELRGYRNIVAKSIPDIEEIIIENKTLKKEKVEIYQKYQDTERKHLNIVHENSELKKTVDKKELDIKEKQRKIEMQDSNIIEMQKKIEKLESGIKEHKVEVFKKELDNKEKQRKIEMQDSNIIEMQKMNQKLELDIKEHEDEVFKKELDIKEKQRKIEMQDSNIIEKQKMNQKLELDIKEHEDEVFKKELDIKEKQRKIEMQDSNIIEKQKMNQKLELDIKEYKVEVFKKELDIKEKQNMIEELELKIKEYEIELSGKNLNKYEKQNNMENQESNDKKLRNEISELEKELKKAEDQIQSGPSSIIKNISNSDESIQPPIVNEKEKCFILHLKNELFYDELVGLLSDKDKGKTKITEFFYKPPEKMNLTSLDKSKSIYKVANIKKIMQNINHVLKLCSKITFCNISDWNISDNVSIKNDIIIESNTNTYTNTSSKGHIQIKGKIKVELNNFHMINFKNESEDNPNILVCDKGKLIIKNALFKNNVNNYSSIIKVEELSSLEVVNTTFDGNQKEVSKHYYECNFINHNKMENDPTTNPYNNIINSNGNAFITDCHFEDNGDISIMSSFSSVSSSTSALNIINSTFKKCHRLFITNKVKATIKNCVFQENAYFFQTGGALLISDEVEVDITECQFVNNVASRGGGICCYDNSKLSIEMCEFTENKAYGRGGAIYMEENVIAKINSSLFKNNTSASDEGHDIFHHNESNIIENKDNKFLKE